MCSCSGCRACFFFQAEDGIRDYKVTGVQTCALPISDLPGRQEERREEGMSTPHLRVLSLGAGIQSSTVLLLSCRRELPTLDAAIFADTQWEPAEVYTHLDWLEAEAQRAGIPVYRVSRGNIRADALRSQVRGGRAGGAKPRFASMPLYTKTPAAVREGMIRRQCTREYKLDMIRRRVRQMLSVAPDRVVPKDTLVEQWIGISTDETRRMRLSPDWWISFRYPLVFDRPMTRAACVAWLAQHYPERRVPRSACIGCPFHSN